MYLQLVELFTPRLFIYIFEERQNQTFKLNSKGINKTFA